MNIIAERQMKRGIVIDKIVDSLKASDIKSNGDGKQYDFNSIIIAVQANTNCSKRTAMEYADIALYKVGLTRSDLKDAPDKTQRRLEM